MALEDRLRQLSVAIGTEGTKPTWSSVETAGNSDVLLYEPRFQDNTEFAERAPFRAQIGMLASVPTTKTGTVTFTAELKGSGTAGTAPQIGKLLRACGTKQTINSGTAVIGAVTRVVGTGTGVVPVLTGTYTGTKSGRLELLITDVVTDTSIDIQATFYPGDGTAPSTDLFSQTSASAVALTGVAAGVSFDFGDPSSATTGYVVGDRFVSKLTSDTQVDVEYTPADNTSGGDLHPVVDLSFNVGGRIQRLYSCRGTFSITGEVGNFATIEFTMSGVIDDTIDQALLTGIDYGDVVPVPFMNLTNVAVLGVDGCFSAISVDIGNEVVPRTCAGAESGVESFRIVSRSATASADPEATLVATHDVYGKLRDGSTGVFSFTLGSTAGNIIEFEAPIAQISAIGDEGREGIAVDAITMNLCQPTSSGTGEFGEFTLRFK
jgi:hypothetical protein